MVACSLAPLAARAGRSPLKRGGIFCVVHGGVARAKRWQRLKVSETVPTQTHAREDPRAAAQNPRTQIGLEQEPQPPPARHSIARQNRPTTDGIDPTRQVWPLVPPGLQEYLLGQSEIPGCARPPQIRPPRSARASSDLVTSPRPTNGTPPHLGAWLAIVVPGRTHRDGKVSGAAPLALSNT